MNPSSSTKIVKKTDRDEKKFRTPDKKFEKKLEIFPGPDSSIISLISNFKIF
jgi:hypothetical protein